MFEKEVSIQAVIYIIERLDGDTADMHKISKVLYFADQMHLSLYGRPITGDDYIKMPYGPVPSKIDDIFKALKGESYFSDCIGDVSEYLAVKNKYVLTAKKECNTDFLSKTDRKCLDAAIEKCKMKSFNEITSMSHDFAWNNTQMGRRISDKDILREVGDSEEYIEYATAKPTFKLNNAI
ncbi:MAG: SocA family protein [Salinivirgaceae bacterium]|nr:SocA family protein [Salinivirgaceae bacterium]